MPSKVLIIEDQKSVYEMLALFLEKKGCQTVGAATAEEGLELTKKLEPDVIVIDVNLPDAKGFEVLERIRSFNKEARIFLCSGLYTEEQEELAKSSGADGFINKASNVEDIIDIIVGASKQDNKGLQ